MDFGALIQSVLYLISSSLFYPALAVLLGAFVTIVAALGAFLAEWAERARLKQPAPADWPAILRGRRHISHFLGGTLDELHNLLNRPEGASWPEVENLWQSARRRAYKRLDYLRVLVRVGPSTGLIATLIPMSTGLAALSQGDMSRLSADMVVAFTATVVGLAVGVTAFVLYSVRSRWAENDLEVLELVMDSRAAAKLGTTP
ncbi:MAG: MotA/TolQ/ExbB proton channel family protein [Candidatus Adiutrix sp.]|jgi:biopolymer transport protein ExbB/TolQ|nr:MotA/TolQ/ExbB proton channel family protein [Candidatus Adiutrix sp.]